MKTVKLLLLVTLVSLNSYGQLGDGLVASYPFGGNANDVSGQNNNGILVGNPTLTSDRFGMDSCAYEFPGDDSNYISIPFSTDFDIADTNAFSLSLWYQGGTDDTGDLEYLFFKSNPSITPIPSDYHLALYDLNSPSFGSQYSPVVMALNLNPIPDTNWYHIVAIYDNKQWYLYQNDVLEGSNLSQTSSIFQSTGEIIIGKGFEGKIDDINFYDKVLSEIEINQLFTASSPHVSTASIHENAEVDFRIYPNPTNNSVTVQLKNLHEPTVEVFDMSGRKINTTIKTTNSGVEVNLEKAPEGFYLIKIISGDKVIVERIQKRN